MSQQANIIGAGLAGLLAGVMLRDRANVIVEKQSGLPNNHTAVMRFRSLAVSDATNIPFAKVNVAWAVDFKGSNHINDLTLAMKYSYDCTGRYDPTSRSIARFLPNLHIGERYISPPGLPGLLFDKLTADILFGSASRGHFNDLDLPPGPIISTIPMDILGRMLGYKFKSTFQSKSGFNVSCKVPDLNCYATLYLPLRYLYKRISITGDTVVAESYRADTHENNFHEDGLSDVMRSGLGLYHIDFNQKLEDFVVHRQRYAKIVPIDETERRQFIRWATRKYNIYSLGRFATWRPGLLLDDIVKDVRVITNMIYGPGIRVQDTLDSYQGK